MYYVATQERSVLVAAVDRGEAWIAGHELLHRIHVQLCEHTELDLPVEVQTVRLATADEIATWILEEEARRVEKTELQADHHVL
jgi:hypothetical protein